MHVCLWQLAKHKLDFLLDFQGEQVADEEVWLLRLLPAVFKHVKQHQLSRDLFGKLLFDRVENLVFGDVLENAYELAADLHAFALF